MGNLHRNSLAGHKILCLVDGCHPAAANHALDLQSAVQGFVRLHFGDHAGRESSMDSLHNGDSLVMLWLVSWSTRTARTASLSPQPWRSAREMSYGKDFVTQKYGIFRAKIASVAARCVFVSLSNF